MVRRTSLGFLLAVFLIGAGGTAAADQAKSYAVVTKVRLQHLVPDACNESCLDVAAQERNRAGPVPAPPLYRTSPTQAAVALQRLIKGFAAHNNVSEAAAAGVFPSWDEAMSEWRDAEPKGNYRPNDLADVLAKYWLFSWMFGEAVPPDRLPESVREAVRAQAHRWFATDAELKLLTEGQMQGLSDMLIRLQTADMLVLMEGAEGKDIGPAMENVVAHFQRIFDVDLHKLAIDPNQGFVLQTSP